MTAVVAVVVIVVDAVVAVTVIVITVVVVDADVVVPVVDVVVDIVIATSFEKNLVKTFVSMQIVSNDVFFLKPPKLFILGRQTFI